MTIFTSLKYIIIMYCVTFTVTHVAATVNNNRIARCKDSCIGSSFTKLCIELCTDMASIKRFPISHSEKKQIFIAQDV